jgi:hypothetical protein
VKIIAFILFGLISITASAQQFAFELWHEGKLILDSGDTLKGKIKYDLQSDLIQYQTNEQPPKLESYTARKVLFFEIFDGTVKRYRIFYSLPYSTAGQYKAPVFFELLEEGKLTVLCREALEYRTSSSFYYYGSYTRLVLIHKYFLLKENGNIEEYRGKKNDWYELMRGKEDEVQKYVRVNRLDLDDKYELAQALNYYNSLFLK